MDPWPFLSRTTGNVAFATALRIEFVTKVDSVLYPFAAQQILLGMETLSLRCDRIAANALQIARFLAEHDRTNWISYPGKWILGLLGDPCISWRVQGDLDEKGS